MEATIFIPELDDYVIFTAAEEPEQEGWVCAHVDILWPSHLYSIEENKIIEKYLHLADAELK